MNGFWTQLFDESGFIPRKNGGTGWNAEMIWLHVGSDLFIWLAFMSIPLVLVYFTRRRNVPFNWLFLLFALFITACGFTHLIDALMFERPVYRISGVLKAFTALLSWITVFALIRVAPKVSELLATAADALPDTALHRPLGAVPSRSPWIIDVIVGILAGVLAVLIRAALDTFLKTDHAFVLGLLAVVYVSWQRGFAAAVMALFVSLVGIVYFFIEPRNSFVIDAFSDMMETALYFFCGVACAALGQSQRHAQKKARKALALALSQKEEFETEVSRRRLVEGALRQREADLLSLNAQLDGFVLNAPVGIAFYDTELRYVRVNRVFAEVNRRSIDSHIGKRSGELIPEFPEELESDFQRVLATGQPMLDRHLVTGPETHNPGTHWRLNLFPVRAKDGETVGLGVIGQDVTVAENATAKLRVSEERFRTLTEAIPQMVWNANALGRVTYFNTKWRDYTGLNSEAMLDDWWQQMVHPDDEPEIRREWRRVLTQDPVPFIRELRLRGVAEGTYRWFQTAVVPLRREDGTVDQWIGSLTDIEERKQQAVVLEEMVHVRTAELVRTTESLRDEIEDRTRAEAAVRSVALELERSNGELEKFAYVASHDLQEPLRKIQAFGDRLRDRCRDQVDEQGREYIDRMLVSAGRMRRLIDDMLAFSRVTTHARPFESVDLNAVAHEAADDLASLLERTGGTLDIGDLPTLEADPSQMRQLMQNLLGNALKFHRPGTPSVVAVRSELIAEPRETRVYRVTVADNGIGFEEKYLGRIFEVFQRLHGRDEYEGTGVGLAICKKIVERHHGTITATSVPGQGSTFILELPARQPGPGELPAPHANSDPAQSGTKRATEDGVTQCVTGTNR